jgi:hypothetical protein
LPYGRRIALPPIPDMDPDSWLITTSFRYKATPSACCRTLKTIGVRGSVRVRVRIRVRVRVRVRGVGVKRYGVRREA